MNRIPIDDILRRTGVRWKFSKRIKKTENYLAHIQTARKYVNPHLTLQSKIDGTKRDWTEAAFLIAQ